MQEQEVSGALSISELGLGKAQELDEQGLEQVEPGGPLQ